MKTALRILLNVTTLGACLLASGRAALADGPYEDYGSQDPAYAPDPNDPNAAYGAEGQAYQPPPEGTCLDDNNQVYDCSSDSDYSSYSQLDDGYDPSAYQDFQSTLAPYGSWVSTEQYGQVWVPSAGVVGADFTPYYSGGHWSMTDYGWTWVSDYSWGWAPFHYGRWHQVGTYGWCWIPGRIWGPAWVHWRLGGGYVGWAPLPPRGLRIGPPIFGGSVGVRIHRWNFVPLGQITAPRLVRVAPPVAVGLWSRTTIATDLRAIGSTRIVYGPPLHHFSSVRVAPTPLRSIQMALPRANIAVRAGAPLTSRPYYAPVYRQNPGVYRVSTPASRPGYPYGGYQPSPGVPRPTYQAPQPAYPRPSYPQTGYPHPSTVNPSPGFPRPAYPAPQPAPGYHPNYPQPAPVHPAPAFPRPSSPSPPSYPQPSAPRPSYQPPVYHNPAPAPVFRAPAPAPAPVFRAPAPTHSAPVFHSPAPVHSAPVFHAPPPRGSAPSFNPSNGHRR